MRHLLVLLILGAALNGQAPAAKQAKGKAVTAQGGVAAIESTATCMASAVGPSNTLAVFNGMVSKEIAEFMEIWAPGLDSLGLDAKKYAVSLMMLPPKIPELFLDGKYEPAKGKLLGERLKQLTPEIVAAGKSALYSFDSRTDDLTAIVMLVRHEPAFREGTFIAGRENQFAVRLTGVSAEVLDRWVAVTGLDRGLAASSLARCEGLFSANGAFSQANYERALTRASELAKARAAVIQ